MAMILETGTVTFPATATGTETVNLANFDASNPVKAVLFFMTFQGTAVGDSAIDTHTIYGMTDGTDEACIHTFSDHNVGTTNTSRSHIARSIAFYNSAKAIIGEATISDWQDDSFELSYSNVSGGGWKVQFLAIGGSSVTDAKVVHWREQEDDESSPKFVSVGFQPDAIIDFASGLLSGTVVSSTVKQADDARACIGFTVGSDMYSHAWESSDGTTASDQYLHTRANSAQSRLTVVASLAEFTPVTNGFDVDLTSEGNTTTTSYVHSSLCLKGVNIKFAEVTSPTSVGDQDFTYTGETVKGALLVGSGFAKGAVSSVSRLNIAAFDGTNNWSVGFNHVDNADPTENYSWWKDDTFIRTYFDTSGSIGMDATVSIVSDETLRLTWTNVEATGRSYCMLIFTEVGEVVRAADNTFSFTSVVAMDAVVVLAANLIGFTDSTEHNYFYVDVSNEFDFDSESGYNWEIDITQYIGLVGPRVIRACTNSFTLDDVVNQAFEESLQNAFSWSDHEALETLKRIYLIENSFGFSVLVTAARLEDCLDDLALSDSVDSSATEYGRDDSQNFIRQSVSYSVSGIDRTCVENEYAIFEGTSGDDSYGAVDLTAPSLTTGTLTLTYPRVGPTTTLVLKNPEFGNTDNLQFRIIDRRTRGGDHIIYGDTKWGNAETLILSIENVCTIDADDLIQFINDSLGKEIGLLDWEGRNWAGVIIAPNTQITNRTGGYTISITFEGELV